MLIVRDLAHFDDILTLTASTCILTVSIICSRTKLLSSLQRKKVLPVLLYLFIACSIYKNHRGRKEYKFLIRPRLVLLMNLTLNNF